MFSPLNIHLQVAPINNLYLYPLSTLWFDYKNSKKYKDSIYQLRGWLKCKTTLYLSEL